MNQNTDKALARQEEIVVKEMPGEVLVYDLRQHKAHCLNKTAALVWSHCDGETTVAEMANRMTEELASPVGEEVVWLALEQLGKANLLQQPIAKPEGVMRLSRRAAMRTIAAAVALPLVVTVVAPTAMGAAASCGNCISSKPTCDCDPNTMGTCYNNNGHCNSNPQNQPITCSDCFTGGGKQWQAN